MPAWAVTCETLAQFAPQARIQASFSVAAHLGRGLKRVGPLVQPRMSHPRRALGGAPDSCRPVLVPGY